MTQSRDLDRVLAEETTGVEAALERAIEGLLPILPEGLRPPARQGVLTGGKRIRPVLGAVAYRACRGRVQDHAALYDLVVSVELIHAYSLMHDDLPCMDDAPLRRGNPTPHILFGEGPTAAAGAVLIPGAGLHLWRSARALGLPEENARELLRILARAAGGGGMVGGQALDLEGEGRSLDRAQLDDLHRRKTGALLTASLEIGAVAAEADPAQRVAMVRYGRAIGLAFQIADDILDATASEERLGKAPSDQELEKSTYVSLLGVEGARSEADRQLAEALRALESAELNAPDAATLADLARFIVQRDH
jgi:geranylgeranyl pyrophosphate synthase